MARLNKLGRGGEKKKKKEIVQEKMVASLSRHNMATNKNCGGPYDMTIWSAHIVVVFVVVVVVIVIVIVIVVVVVVVDL